ncbi:hypothetical protein [Streptomyces sp. SID3343]|uniref:hypothetical protein n=1 Tax=Streptomyces sp. SID3343 TaxID=2690260 RepID=UPI00136A6862|nr:hypothetical protein [Streptomyces sp. SID3343]
MTLRQGQPVSGGYDDGDEGSTGSERGGSRGGRPSGPDVPRRAMRGEAFALVALLVVVVPALD